MSEIFGVGAEVATRQVNRLVKNRMPADGYTSTVGVYGGEIRQDKNGKLVYDTRVVKPNIFKGIMAGVDVAGDRFLRRFDDHVVKEPREMLRRHPRSLARFVFGAEPKRHRGSKEEIVANIERLELTDKYGAHEWGIEIKNPEEFTTGITIKDIFRANEIGAEKLQAIDRFQALASATEYIRQLHDTVGPIGDFIDDMYFTSYEDGLVAKPTLNIPDIVLTPSEKRIAAVRAVSERKVKERKAIQEGRVSDSYDHTNVQEATHRRESVAAVELNDQEQDEVTRRTKESIEKEEKATDILEFLVHTAFLEYQRSADTTSVQRTMQVIIDTYGDNEILDVVKSFAKRGRPTLPGDSKPKGPLRQLFTAHNTVHLAAEKEHAQEVRQMIIATLESK